MSRIYENLFFKFDYKTHSDTNVIELQENCTFLKRCCCEISSFASQYNYNDVQANGYFSLLAVVVNFDKILSKEITKQRPKLKKYIIISRCLRLMFEILLEFRDSMDKSTPGNEKYLLASHHEVGFKGFTYTQTQLQELSVIFGTIGPFWLYKSFQKVIQQIAVGIALLQPFPKSLVVIRNRRSRSLKYAKSAISGKTFKLLNLCDTKLYAIYINLHYWRSCVKSVTKFVALDRVIEIHNDNLTLNLKQNDVKKRIRFRYLFNCQKLEERKDLLIHIHGGCFVKSSPDAHEIYLKDWAFKLSNVPIIAVDYTKAKFPAGLQDVVDLYLWLTTNSDVSSELGFKPNRIVLSGDSAGANIAVAVSLVLNDANKSFPSVNITFPAGILSVYGAFKVLPLMSPSRLLSGIDPMLYQTLMLNSLYYYSGANEYEVIDKQICSKKQQKLWFQRDDEEIKQVFTTITNALSNAYASPLLYSSFNEMPSIPLSLISCHFCPLLDDTIELAKIWKGIVKLHVFDGLPHGFLNFLPKSIEVQTASDECIQVQLLDAIIERPLSLIHKSLKFKAVTSQCISTGRTNIYLRIMPAINFEKIVDCSSEDEEFCAKNLLNKDLIKSWKTANVGEAQAFVILQLNSMSKISSLEIGGEASAFIEVFVRRSNSESSEFQVLLSPSSFMTPSESKSGTNVNRVRFFDKSKLCPSSVEESWDQVKVVCTQPFNKSVKYGIAFLRVISPSEEDESVEETSLSSLKLGAFKVKPSTSNQTESSAVGSWFAKRDKTATTVDDKDNNKMALRRKEPKKPSLAVAAGITPKRQRKETPKTTQNSQKKATVANDANLSSRKTATVSKKTVPFNKVMSKVIFAISGIQNPERAEIRSKALEMGAKYKADWDNTCTHLICAFVNTPKYSQVIAVKGRIVTKNWIYDCYTQKKRLQWRDYKLGQYSDKSSPEESEEEADPANSSYYIETDDEEAQQIETSLNTSVKKVDVCERVAALNTSSENTVNDDSVYDLETESESDDLKQQNVACKEQSLKRIFNSKHFNLYGNFEESERTKLKHYIITFGGNIEETVNDKVNYVISHSSWNEDFENALTVNEHILFVRPKWIFSCNERNKLVPFQCYIIPANFE